MDNPLETFKVGRFTVKLYQDTDAEAGNLPDAGPDADDVTGPE